MHPSIVNVLQGSRIRMGVLVFHPPRNGPTIWEIGVPDRTTAEFYVPEPNPTLMNQLQEKSQVLIHLHSLQHLTILFYMLIVRGGKIGMLGNTIDLVCAFSPLLLSLY
ncbi:Carbohydrate-binding-like fold [Artemisia annua]|uniref:Carbohydrate-binding-like fold n=1 Tax=Artemisia annua TaxID=35608 RepID=A0A2U1PBJ1_ARTAN|nr:Carbohydrate-binding-like fold [Artemisia annua]